MNKEIHQRFKEICRKNEWKCTPQRLAVYDFIYENYTHPDVDVVWGKVKAILPSVARESIYRILNEFAAHGLIHRLDHIDHARYDGQIGPHGHFLCTHCGEIQDFPFSDTAGVPNNDQFGDIEHLELRLTGICKHCRKQEPQHSEKQP